MFRMIFLLAMIWAMPFGAFAQDGVSKGDSIAADAVVNPSSKQMKAAANAQFDVNGDNVMDLVDVVDIIRYVMKKASTSFNVGKADVNGDGKVDVGDAKALSVLLTGGELPASSNTPELRGDAVIDPTAPN